MSIVHNPRLSALAIPIALSLGYAACAMTPTHGARSAQNDPAGVIVGNSDLRGLATAALAAIDWSRVCDQDASCSVVRVDSVVREVQRLTVPRSATRQVAVLGISDLPATRVRYILGEREYVDRGEDAILTLVVVLDPRVPEWYPKGEIEVTLLRPRRDVVLVSLKAEFIEGKWIVKTVDYAHS
jgi:hypothetical protein